MFIMMPNMSALNRPINWHYQTIHEVLYEFKTSICKKKTPSVVVVIITIVGNY